MYPGGRLCTSRDSHAKQELPLVIEVFAVAFWVLINYLCLLNTSSIPAFANQTEKNRQRAEKSKREIEMGQREKELGDKEEDTLLYSQIFNKAAGTIKIAS